MAESSPEHLLTALFIQASLQYPAHISGQGIWLAILFREWKDIGRIPDSVSLYALKSVLSSDTKNDVLQTIATAAHHAHGRLADKPTLSPERVERIVTEVLRLSGWCQDFERSHLDAFLEMLPIYMQVGAYASGNDEQDVQNPELTRRKILIKHIAQRTLEGEFQRLVSESVDEILFTDIPSWHNYVDQRFGIFIMRLSLLHRRNER